jgi:uncharacterized membrane protein
MNDIIDPEREKSLKTIGIVSYALHTIVALGAVLPGLEGSVLLLLVALLIDIVKKDDAAGTWQESHFKWRIRSVVCGALCGDCAFVFVALLSRKNRLDHHFDLVRLPHHSRVFEPQ